MEIEIKREYYEYQNIWYERSYMNNIMHGIQKCYHENGQLCREWHVMDHQMYSIYKFWHADGRRYFIQQLKNNQSFGIIIKFIYEQ